MRSIFRNELSSYFTGPIGHVFGAFLLLFAGIYTMILNINAQLTNFEYVFGNMSFIYLIVIPILTMRVLAEERRQKTDQLLYSLPLSMTQVVLGKFAAMAVTLLIPVGLICVYPIILSAFGNVHMPSAFTAAAGFFLLGAALLSVGMLISALTESQAVAAGVCFVVMLLNYYLNALIGFLPASSIASVAVFSCVVILMAVLIRQMTGSGFIGLMSGLILETILLLAFIIKPEMFIGLAARVVGKLSLFERFYVFVNGIFDVSGVVYFLSVIAFFLFLSVQALEKRRWSE